MTLDFRERGRWLARNLLPHEPMLRARLRQTHLYGLEADDIIQEVYARIVSQPSLEAIRHPRQYAIQTTNAIIIDHIRHSRIVPIHAGVDLDNIEVAAPDGAADAVLEFREEIDRVKSFLDALPPRTRDVLVLRRVEGLSQNQTAERLGISAKTVEKHMASGIWEMVQKFGRGGNFRNRPSKTDKHDNHGNDEKTVSPGD